MMESSSKMTVRFWIMRRIECKIRKSIHRAIGVLGTYTEATDHDRIACVSRGGRS